MNDDLYTLKVACYLLKDLKKDELAYNRALVKTASIGLLKDKLDGMEKKAWLWPALLTSGAILAGAYLQSNGRDMSDYFSRGLNWINSDWGQDAVVRYANSGRFTPEERNMYLIRHLSDSKNYRDVRNVADAYLNAKREAAYRHYKDYDADSRANRMIQQAMTGSGSLYSSVRNGGSGFSYNSPYSMFRY